MCNRFKKKRNVKKLFKKCYRNRKNTNPVTRFAEKSWFKDDLMRFSCGNKITNVKGKADLVLGDYVKESRATLQEDTRKLLRRWS